LELGRLRPEPRSKISELQSQGTYLQQRSGAPLLHITPADYPWRRLFYYTTEYRHSAEVFNHYHDLLYTNHGPLPSPR